LQQSLIGYIQKKEKKFHLCLNGESKSEMPARSVLLPEEPASWSPWLLPPLLSHCAFGDVSPRSSRTCHHKNLREEGRAGIRAMRA
jgi:hypothetical protein